MYSGVVPQHPPTTLTPAFICMMTSSANSSTVTSNTVSPFSTLGSPAFGLKTTGVDETRRNSSMTPRSWRGPTEQFVPIASAPMPSSMDVIADGVAPVMSCPFASKASVTITGRSQFSFTARSAALVSRQSFIVSMDTRSAPALTPIFTIFANAATASSNASCPYGSRSCPKDPMSSDTNFGRFFDSSDASSDCPAASLTQLIPAKITFSNSSSSG